MSKKYDIAHHSRQIQNQKNNNSAHRSNAATRIGARTQTWFAFGSMIAVSLIVMTFALNADTPVAIAADNDDNNTNRSYSATYVDSARFVQYLDENTALEEVREGNLGMYYFRIASDRLETQQSRQGLNVFESTGGSYSMLVNPAISADVFNPFQDPEIRFAINYLVDRRLIVNELMGGYGIPIISHYGPSDPEYLTVIENLASFDFRYNPALATKMISERLYAMGADKSDGAWQMNSEPIALTFFIRSDDPVRKSIGEILASEFEQMGFAVKKEYGDLNKAFVVVYGSNPADLKWHIYTEGWAKSAFVRYDSTGLAQMYSPWFSNMPGFNNPSYWNYENEHLDNATRRIYTGDFLNEQERASLIREAITKGVTESVRIFLASKTDQYVTHESISGVVNDFGAGLPSRFTPINARIDQVHGDGISNSNNETPNNDAKNEIRIGVKQIYQGSWNPVMGFRDAYSSQIGTLLSDPATFKHPYTGETIPIRVTWNVTTAGPDRTLDVPDDAIMWNPVDQRWNTVDANANATSVVLFEYKLGNWHNGEPMDMLDIIHSFYFAKEWGTQTGPDDTTFDTEFTSIVAPSVETIKGIRPLGGDTIEVYVDYWHFDQGEIAQWASPGVTMPWEMIVAMERAVMDGKTSFSRSGAASKSISWLSVIIPTDVKVLRSYLESMRDANHVPASLSYDPQVGLPHAVFDFEIFANNPEKYYLARYDSAISWIVDTGHAMISNGPFYLDSYSPESRSIRIISFDDRTYPFERGAWSGFERAAFPLIVGLNIEGAITRGEKMQVNVATKNSDAVLYFVTSGSGSIVSSGVHNVTTYDSNMFEGDNVIDGDFMADEIDAITTISVTAEDTMRLSNGANSIRVFALSDAVLKPDYFETGFLAIEDVVGDSGNTPVTTPMSPTIRDKLISGGNASMAMMDAPLNESQWQSLLPQQQQQQNVQQSDDDDDDKEDMGIYYLMLIVGAASIVFGIMMRFVSKSRNENLN